MIGAIAGDIIGSVYEFHYTKSLDFDLFTASSTFTDDTVMTHPHASQGRCPPITIPATGTPPPAPPLPVSARPNSP
jgi:hypothetical protein